MKEDKDEKDTGFIITAVVVSIIIIGLWFFTYCTLKDLSVDERSSFGDMFGSVNAIYSGLALAGIVLTILLQRKELKLQRQELKDTRKEFETQNETLKIQRFENTFFNLLNQHHQIVNAIDFRYYKSREKDIRYLAQAHIKSNTPAESKEVVVINGRDVFRYRYNKLFEELSKNENEIEFIYSKHYEQAQTDFGHYFRNLYRMIKIVDETDFFYDTSKVSKEQVFAIKYKYTSIIRAQLSDYELLWLFYNCITTNGNEKFKKYIEQYSLLKNMPKILPFESHLALYEPIAFMPK